MHYISHTNNEKLTVVFLGTFHHHIQRGSCGLLSKELEIKWLQHKSNHPIARLRHHGMVLRNTLKFTPVFFKYHFVN